MDIPRPWLQGGLAAVPVVPGILFGGIIYGAAAAGLGMPPWTIVGTCLLVATGTAQFVALELLSQGIAWWTIVLVGLLINLRFAVYGLHLGGFAKESPWWQRLAYYGLVTDEGYAITLSRLRGDRPAQPSAFRWSLALLMMIWLPWPLGAAIGSLTGRTLPDGLGIELAIPLTLLNVLVLLATTSRHLRVALIAGTVGLLLRSAPFGLGLLAAIAAGVAVGMLGSKNPLRDSKAAC